MVSLGQRVKELREKSGLSQAAFKAKHGFNTNKIEAGERGAMVRHETLVALAGAFECSVAQLVRGTEHEEAAITAKRIEKMERATELAHKNPQVEEILTEFGDRLTYQQAKDLMATAAVKGTTVDEIREMAKMMTQKSQKRVEERAVDAPQYARKSTTRSRK